MSDDRDILHFNIHQSRRFQEAAEARQRFAEQHGFADFEAVMKRGIQAVGNGHGKTEHRAPVSNRPLNSDELLARAKVRMGIAEPDRETGEVA